MTVLTKFLIALIWRESLRVHRPVVGWSTSSSHVAVSGAICMNVGTPYKHLFYNIISSDLFKHPFSVTDISLCDMDSLSKALESPRLSSKNAGKSRRLKYKNPFWCYTCLCVSVCVCTYAVVKLGIPLMSEVIKQSKRVGSPRSKTREWAGEPFTSTSTVSV